MTEQRIEKPVKKIRVWTRNSNNKLVGVQFFDSKNNMILETLFDCYKSIYNKSDITLLEN